MELIEETSLETKSSDAQAYTHSILFIDYVII